MLMRRRNSENTTHAMSKNPAIRRPANNRLLELKRSIVSDVVWMVAGARTVAGEETAVVVAGSLLADELAALCCVFAFDVSGAVAGLWAAIALDVSGAVAGLC